MGRTLHRLSSIPLCLNREGTAGLVLEGAAGGRHEVLVGMWRVALNKARML